MGNHRLSRRPERAWDARDVVWGACAPALSEASLDATREKPESAAEKKSTIAAMQSVFSKEEAATFKAAPVFRRMAHELPMEKKLWGRENLRERGAMKKDAKEAAAQKAAAKEAAAVFSAAF